MDKIQWKVLKPATEVWSNEWVKVLSTRVRLPTGVETDFFMLDNPDGVAVLAVDDDHNAILNRQFRPALGDVIAELPAGLIEKGEERESAARRELAEEAGLSAKEMRFLGSFYRNPAKDTGTIHVYFARVGASMAPQQERYEHMETIKVPIQELIRSVLGNEIQDVTTVFAVLMLKSLMERQEVGL